MTLSPNTQITQENVGLLKAGDVLRGKTHGFNLGELRQFRSVLVGGSEAGAVYYDGAPYGGGTAHCSHFTYIGPDLGDGWIGWSGGENPVPGMRVDVKLRHTRTINDTPSEEWVWQHDDYLLDDLDHIIAFRPALSPPAEGVGEVDQVLRWSKALFESNAFYEHDHEDTLSWAEMASPDGGIRDLHAEMAMAALAVWDREATPTPAPVDWERVGPKLVEALRIIAAAKRQGTKTPMTYAGGFDAGCDWASGVAERALAILAAQPSAGAQGEATMFGPEIAYGALWRTIGTNPRLHEARRTLLEVIGGQGSEGQRRGVAWAVANLGEPSDADIMQIDNFATPAQPDTGDVAALRKALEAYEAWEAALIAYDPAWRMDHGHPFGSDELYEMFIDAQTLRNAALSKPNAPGAR